MEKFKEIVISYYKKNKRVLPWRETKDPYHIVVSELMLQQTQVPRVLQKYPLFMKEFPTFSTLSHSSTAQILKSWQGLGYNRRALYVKKIADIVTSSYKGVLPDDPLILKTFPGIGIATASAISVFAWNKPYVFIETNIRRTFIYHFFKNKKNVHDKEIMPFIEKSLDKKNPREWYYALMDYGTALGKQIENPNRSSSHYTKQSKFKGSTRQSRGKILQALIQYEKITELDLKNRVNCQTDLFDKALLQLKTEGFLEITDTISLKR